MNKKSFFVLAVCSSLCLCTSCGEKNTESSSNVVVSSDAATTMSTATTEPTTDGGDYEKYRDFIKNFVSSEKVTTNQDSSIFDGSTYTMYTYTYNYGGLLVVDCTTSDFSTKSVSYSDDYTYLKIEKQSVPFNDLMYEIAYNFGLSKAFEDKVSALSVGETYEEKTENVTATVIIKKDIVTGSKEATVIIELHK